MRLRPLAYVKVNSGFWDFKSPDLMPDCRFYHYWCRSTRTVEDFSILQCFLLLLLFFLIYYCAFNASFPCTCTTKCGCPASLVYVCVSGHAPRCVVLWLAIVFVFCMHSVKTSPAVYSFCYVWKYTWYLTCFLHLDWSCFPFSWVIFGYMTCLCDCGSKRECDRESVSERMWLAFSFVSLSFCLFFTLFLLLMIERHSFSPPPKEPHVFGQSGGVMHECMPCLLLSWPHLMPLLLLY